MERYGGGPIVVTDYNPEWPGMFKQERATLDTALGSLALAIEHVGSTAVSGLAAKPIIDLLVGVRSLEEARSRCIEVLQAFGYTYMPEYQSWSMVASGSSTIMTSCRTCRRTRASWRNPSCCMQAYNRPTSPISVGNSTEARRIS